MNSDILVISLASGDEGRQEHDANGNEYEIGPVSYQR